MQLPESVIQGKGQIDKWSSQYQLVKPQEIRNILYLFTVPDHMPVIKDKRSIQAVAVNHGARQDNKKTGQQGTAKSPFQFQKIHDIHPANSHGQSRMAS